MQCQVSVYTKPFLLLHRASHFCGGFFELIGVLWAGGQATLESTRDSLAEELVKATAQVRGWSHEWGPQHLLSPSTGYSTLTILVLA